MISRGVTGGTIDRGVVGSFVLRRHGKVVINELAPLHHHQVVPRVQLLQSLQDPAGHRPGVGQGATLDDRVGPAGGNKSDNENEFEKEKNCD